MSTCVLDVSPVHSFTTGSKVAVNGTIDGALGHILARYITCHTDMPAQTEELNRLIAETAPQVFRWDFDVCALARKSGGRPLYVTFMAIIQQLRLLDTLPIPKHVLQAYITQVEANYKSENPYHNNVHAADVTQTAAVLLSSLAAWLRRMGCALSPLQQFAILLSSAVHDLAHPGVNNDYHVKVRGQVAVRYNDKSPNENMHISMAFQLAMEDPDIDIFAGLSEAQYKELRFLCINMVLSTDMSQHFKLLERFQALQVANPAAWKPEDWSTVVEMLVHLADLANPSRPRGFAVSWAEKVITEFVGQGEQEKAAGVPVSSMCNRDTICMPNAQLGFINVFMRATLAAFASVAPSFFALTSPFLEDTAKLWEYYRDAGVMMPPNLGGTYPQLPADLEASQAALNQMELDEAAAAQQPPQQWQQQAAAGAMQH